MSDVVEVSEASDYIFKVICIGDAATGKSSLTIRFAHNTFTENYTLTLAMNLVTRHISLQENTIEIAIWDVAGQPSFKTILPMYFRGSLGALVVYDLTNMTSFENVVHWIEDVRIHCEEIPLVIMGNKSDLVAERVITKEQGMELAEKIRKDWSADVHFLEVSAKEDQNVTDAFLNLTDSILKLVEEEEKALEVNED